MNERAYYGHESQLFGVEEYRLAGGKGDGMRLLQVKTAWGWNLPFRADSLRRYRKTEPAWPKLAAFSRSTATLTRPIMMTGRPDGSRTLQRAF